MQLTDEQKQAVAMAQKMRSFKISALAGTGKTTTLVEIARSFGGKKRGLYLSFNKGIATEAQKKFVGTGCEARTFHSLAFASHGKKYVARMQKVLNASYLRDRFSISGSHSVAVSEIALGTLSRFLRSVDNEVTSDHLAWNDSCRDTFAAMAELRTAYASCEDDSGKTKIRQMQVINDQECRVCNKIAKEAIVVANAVFGEMQRPHSDVPVTHDLYLREFVMSNPDLSSPGFGYDYIMFDEAQDADHLMLLLTGRQSIPIFYVGDAYQQIYEWRGAKNAMESLDLPETPLTTSFRFGQEIADDANDVLRSLNARFLLRGRPGMKSRVEINTEVSGARAIVARTNEEVIGYAAGGLGRRQKVGVSGRADIRSFLRDYRRLDDGRPSGRFALFKTVQDLLDHAASAGDGGLKTMLKLIDHYGVDALDSVMESVVDLDADKNAWKQCDLVVITAHKSKGMEFDSVLLTDGLFNPKRLVNDEERRLLYVAKTRAINTLKQRDSFVRIYSQVSAEH